MSTIDDYFATLTPPVRAEFERIRRLVHDTVTDVEEGTSYAMPAYLYNGKGLLSAMANKNFLSLYPFSGQTIDTLKDKLQGYELTSGSIHFSLEKPLPESLLKEILLTRQKEITK